MLGVSALHVIVSTLQFPMAPDELVVTENYDDAMAAAISYFGEEHTTFFWKIFESLDHFIREFAEKLENSGWSSGGSTPAKRQSLRGAGAGTSSSFSEDLPHDYFDDMDIATLMGGEDIYGDDFEIPDLV